MHEILKTTEINKMVSRVKALAKVKVSEKEIENTLLSIFDHLNYINSISEYDYQIYDRPLDEVFVINEFKDFVRPKSVKLDASSPHCVEMLTMIHCNQVLNYHDWVNLQAEFRGWFKSDLAQNITKISDLKKCVSWSEIRHMASYVVLVEENDDPKDTDIQIITKSGDSPFYPIRLNCDMFKYFRSRYFDCLESEEIEDYLDNWLI